MELGVRADHTVKVLHRHLAHMSSSDMVSLPSGDMSIGGGLAFRTSFTAGFLTNCRRRTKYIRGCGLWNRVRFNDRSSIIGINTIFWYSPLIGTNGECPELFPKLFLSINSVID